MRPLSPEFAAAIARVTRQTGTLLIADEIQCGLGRTGWPFHFQSFGWTPDLVTVGKAIGSGIPIGAALVAEHVAKEIFPGDHGTTYGGNLLSTRAALHVLERIESLTPSIKELSSVFEEKLNGLQAKHRSLASVRGAGLMRGLELDRRAAGGRRRAEGRLAGESHRGTVVRMLPPLTVTAEEIDEAVRVLDVLASMSVEEVKA